MRTLAAGPLAACRQVVATRGMLITRRALSAARAWTRLRVAVTQLQRRRRSVAGPLDPVAAVGVAAAEVAAVGVAAAEVMPMRLPPGIHRQPDGTTCGPAAAVMAHYLADPARRADQLGGRSGFAQSVREMHRTINRRRDRRGRQQFPWPRALGTQPWALARELSGDGRPYRVRFDHPGERGRDFDRVVASVRAGHPAALYIGNAVAPRHVVLAFAANADGTTLRIYDPSSGGEVALPRTAYVDAHLALAGWDEPWMAVLPA